MKISPMYNTVLGILNNIPSTRSSDKKLIIAVYNQLGFDTTRSFDDILFLAPPMETITRCRRKAQERHPELRACDGVDDKRTVNMMDFARFAKIF